MAPSSSKSRRRGLALAGTAALALALAACSSPASSGTPAGTGSAAPAQTTINFWHFFTDREATVIQTAVDNFMAANPQYNVVVSSGQDDDKMRQAIAAGQPIDVGISYDAASVGPMCSTGGFQDLGPYISRDNVDMSQIPQVAQQYTAYKGIRCTLPMLADAYALYYNKDLFAAAGITDPPKTLDELTADAVKLTTYNDDGSIKTIGFMPLMGYYETNETSFAPSVQAKWFNDDGTSAIGSDPNWKTLYTWQKDLIEKLGGYDKLAQFQAGLGEEFSAQNDFQTGRTAMAIDGEFRTAFIDDQAPDLNYGVAPTPVSSDHLDAYGAGSIGGNVIGIGKGSPNPDAAWALIKYLALDTDAQVQMGNGLKNVPTILSAVQSPNLEVTGDYQVFLDTYSNPNSISMPSSPVANDAVNDLEQFAQDWQSGVQTDLAAGLTQVDQQINDALALSGN